MPYFSIFRCPCPWGHNVHSSSTVSTTNETNWCILIMPVFRSNLLQASAMWRLCHFPKQFCLHFSKTFKISKNDFVTIHCNAIQYNYNTKICNAYNVCCQLADGIYGLIFAGMKSVNLQRICFGARQQTSQRQQESLLWCDSVSERCPATHLPAVTLIRVILRHCICPVRPRPVTVSQPLICKDGPSFVVIQRLSLPSQTTTR